jgi:O-antigen/teichoic acid export membrane protein
MEIIHSGGDVLLARTASLESYGTYVYVITWSAILILPVRFGMDTSMVRFAALYNADGKWSELRGLLVKGTQYPVVGGFVMGTAIFFVTYIGRQRLGPSLVESFWVTILIIPLLALVGIYAGAIRGLMHGVISRLPIQVLQPLILSILFVGYAWGINGTVNAPRILLLHLLALITVFITTAVLLNHFLPERVRTTKPAYETKKWQRVSLHLLLISGMYVLMGYTDVIMVGIFRPEADVGLYSAASRLANLVLFGLNAINVISAPLFAVLYSRRDFDELQNVVSFCGLALFIFSVPVGLVLIFFGDSILSIFGAQYIAGFGTLKILVIGQTVNAVVGSVGLLMTMTGHERQAAWTVGASTMVNILLNALLIPKMGIVGAAAATTISTILWNLVLVYQVWKYLGVNTLSFAPILRRTLTLK